MCGIKLKDYAPVANIIARLQVLAPDLFIFKGVTPEQLNDMLIYNHGNRTVYEGVLGADLDSLSILLLGAYLEKWLLLPGYYKQVEIGANSYKTKKEVIETLGNKDVANKVAAFNSDVLITDGADIEITKGEVVRTITDSAFDLNAVFNNLTLLDKTAIINTVLHDIANFYCVSIYL